MRNIKTIEVLVLFLLFFSVSIGYTQNLSDYLILENIGSYSNSGKGRCGKGPGVLAAAGHFGDDHSDLTCRTGYYNIQQDVAVSIQVTQHAGADSDKWLLHELDADFRNYYGIPGRSYGPREIEGQTVLEDAVAGADYRWVSGNKVIMIKYRDSEMTKPEPIEVVKAYLAKHPSTLSTMKLSELRSPENKTIWIKDEMDRQLWFCDKWFLQVQMGKAEQKETLRTVVKNVFVFLDYREKYYGMKAREEKILLDNSLINNDGTSIKTKLSEYKTWWSVNKTKSISLP